jgi:hypothetical protein
MQQLYYFDGCSRIYRRSVVVFYNDLVGYWRNGVSVHLWGRRIHRHYRWLRLDEHWRRWA